MFKKKHIVMIVVAFFVVVLLGGCGTDTLVENRIEKSIKDATGQKTDVDFGTGGLNMQGEDGTSIQSGEDVKLPDDFPKDVYVIDGKIIVALKNMYGAGYNLSIMSDKSVEEAKSLYREKLTADGWKVGLDATIGDIVMFSGQKEKRTVSVSITTDTENNKTSVAVTTLEPTE